MDLKKFGLYITKLREKSGYSSQRELAEASGISHSTINRIESGSHKASPDNLKILAKYLKGVTYSDLMINIGYLEEDDITSIELDIPPNINIAYLNGVKHELTPEVARRLKEDIKLFEELKKQWMKDQEDK